MDLRATRVPENILYTNNILYYFNACLAWRLGHVHPLLRVGYGSARMCDATHIHRFARDILHF